MHTGMDEPRSEDLYNAEDDFRESILEAFRVIRIRMAAGGPGWKPHLTRPLELEYK